MNDDRLLTALAEIATAGATSVGSPGVPPPGSQPTEIPPAGSVHGTSATPAGGTFNENSGDAR